MQPKINKAIDALASAAFVEGGVSADNTRAARDLTEQRKRELLEAIGSPCLHQISEPAPTTHPDDQAVDAIAVLMKAKLAKQRAKGYGGWDTDCTQQRLSEMLRDHVAKGDPVDVANFCAFLLARGEGIAAAPQAALAAVPEGWKLVPKTATNDMAHAGKTADGRLSAFKYADAWVAMLAAAPAHPAEGVPAPVSASPTFMTADQGLQWAWNDVRVDLNAKSWNASESANFYGFFLNGWNYRGQYELQRAATTTALKQELTAAPVVVLVLESVAMPANPYSAAREPGDHIAWAKGAGAVFAAVEAALAATPAAPAPSDEAIMAWAMEQQTDAIKALRASGFVRVARAVLARWAAVVPAAAPDARQWLQEADMAALERFAETTEDDQSYDIGKDAVKRLAHFGCVESTGFGRYSITAFGSYVLGDWVRARDLPFMTQADRDAEHRAAIAASAAQGGAA